MVPGLSRGNPRTPPFPSRFGTGAYGNYFRYSNPAVDRMLQAASSTVEEAPRRELYQRAERLISDDVPRIPSDFNSISMLVSPRLKGWIDDDEYPQSRC